MTAPSPSAGTVLDVTHVDDGLPTTHTECATSVYGRMMRHLGLEPRVLGDSWGYRYDPHGDEWPVGRQRLFVQSHGDVLRGWYGIERRAVVHADSAAAWRYMRTVVDDGRLVALTVDLYSWPRSSFHGLRHFPHRIIVAGYHDDEVFVVDGQGAGRWCRWVPLDVVTAAATDDALAAAHGGEDGRNATLDLPRPAGDPPVPDPDRCLARLRDNTARYLRPESVGGQVQGRVAVREFCRDLATYARGLTEFPSEHVVPGLSFLGTLATQRQFNAMFVALAAERTGAPLGDDAAALTEIARNWRQLYHMLLYGFHAGRDLAPLFRKLTQRLVDVARQEARAIEELDGRLAAFTGG
jgi:hypothetical protein